ncbi:hypothetical protein D9611_000731 [Ephemerocybe angulata]|uniref:Nephrocystin 3-like N-terminal domain-containing protein n=1 Tax=Ephemerocybe angulata TaxID=980116 RepID=A0A8H5BNE3_9AGAR|nr:hypothetical protein D9611_000731 [Tulosesus angulatus]
MGDEVHEVAPIESPELSVILDSKIRMPSWWKTLTGDDRRWEATMIEARSQARRIVAIHKKMEKLKATPKGPLEEMRQIVLKMKGLDQQYRMAKTIREARKRCEEFVKHVELYKATFTITLTTRDFDDILEINASHDSEDRTMLDSLLPPFDTRFLEDEDPSLRIPTAVTISSGSQQSAHPSASRQRTAPSMSPETPSSPPQVTTNVIINLQSPSSSPSSGSSSPQGTPNLDWPQLRRRIAEQNLYDSGHVLRNRVPELDIETREDILDTFADWFSTVNRNSCIHWLRGPIQSGKTVVIQHVVERCIQLGQPTASFFFTLPIGHASIVSNLAPTIAHDIIRCMIPRDRDYYTVLGWLSTSGPSCLGSRMDKQVRGIIFRVFQHLQSKQNAKSKPLLIVLDGLDMCDTDALKEVFRFVENCIRLLPVCFILSSEASKAIERCLSSDALQKLTSATRTDLVPYTLLTSPAAP